jgi:hypothetical protein
MTILLRMDDKMNRQLTCPVSQTDTSMLLAQELVHFGFINEVSIVLMNIRFNVRFNISYEVYNCRTIVTN